MIAIIILLLQAITLVLPANASFVNSSQQIDEFGHNATVLSWHPQVVDNVYVNGTKSETIEYSITMSGPMSGSDWSVDGMPAGGVTSGNTSSYMHTWDNGNMGLHTVIYRGNNPGSETEFRWYVNVYETGERGGSVFDILNDALEEGLIDIKIRIFKYQISKQPDYNDLAIQEVNELRDETAKRKMEDDTLRQEFRTGNITLSEYVAALEQSQREARYNIKFAKELARFALIELKNENLSREFNEIDNMIIMSEQ